jgi:hypothetical protein
MTIGSNVLVGINAIDEVKSAAYGTDINHLNLKNKFFNNRIFQVEYINQQTNISSNDYAHGTGASNDLITVFLFNAARQDAKNPDKNWRGAVAHVFSANPKIKKVELLQSTLFSGAGFSEESWSAGVINYIRKVGSDSGFFAFIMGAKVGSSQQITRYRLFKSTDGVNWSNIVLKVPLPMTGESGYFRPVDIPVVVGNSKFLVLYNQQRGFVSYDNGVTWGNYIEWGVKIATVEWYKKTNGDRVLVVVALTKTGMYAKDIFDENGLPLTEPWKEPTEKWNIAINRIDAMYAFANWKHISNRVPDAI